MDSRIRIAITTGDNDGIGPEVVSRALQKIGPQKNIQFVLFRSSAMSTKWLKPLARKFKMLTVQSVAQGLWTDHKSNLIDIPSDQSPALWVELAARLCMEKQVHGLATGPLSKTEIIRSGLRDIGHTEILARVSGHNRLFMGFVGSHFSVVLATGHIPLAKVAEAFDSKVLMDAASAAVSLRSILPKSKHSLPIALVGMNPHAGESGLLGQQEAWMKSSIHRFSDIHGPLVPDAAFLKENWKKYSVYICPYHDQGLIPFKLVHGFEEGVHLTLGLPFVRTSVDHGTAKDLVGKNMAKPGSMIAAIQTAIKLCRPKRSS